MDAFINLKIKLMNVYKVEMKELAKKILAPRWPKHENQDSKPQLGSQTLDVKNFMFHNQFVVILGFKTSMRSW